jgi:hypothetical protein
MDRILLETPQKILQKTQNPNPKNQKTTLKKPTNPTKLHSPWKIA